MKSEIVFLCTHCGKQLLKWMGRCPGCGEWNSIVEKQPTTTARADGRRPGPVTGEGPLVRLSEIKGELEPRLRTSIGELDRVLGGGLVRGSVVLMGGDPGMGKSTLLMQALGSLAQAGETVLYASGEESAEQIKLRGQRIGVGAGEFLVLVENQLEPILEQIGETDASVVGIDSVQAVYSPELSGHPGSVSQVRQVADKILGCIKGGPSACVLVGHVTKDGVLAGPKVLEHMVDTVLYFEGERGHPYRILRAVKNRFGSALEIGVFEMGDQGLIEVDNPSALFLSEKPEGVSGSTVTALVEGSRPILTEIQALVTGPIPGQGRRTCIGVDPQRLALMIAVIEKKLGLTLGDHDIFVNAVGGIKATEPAVDLPVVAALLSSFLDRPIPAGSLVFGEVGLAGEVRRVSRAAERVNEAARLGFGRIVAPTSNAEQTPTSRSIHITGICHIGELAAALFGPPISP